MKTPDDPLRDRSPPSSPDGGVAVNAPPSGARRMGLLVAAGAAAAAAGLGWQLWRPTGSGPAGRPEQAADDGVEAMWQSRFEQPDGSPLVMSTLRGSPLVLNFWATWCPPCLKEMPALDRFARDFRAVGGHVVGLAIDNPQAVRKYLTGTPVSYAIGMAGFEGTALSRQLGNDKGALPFTAAFGRDGRLRHARLGETSAEELAGWAPTL